MFCKVSEAQRVPEVPSGLLGALGLSKLCCLACWASFGPAKPCCLTCWAPFWPSCLLSGRPLDVSGPLWGASGGF